MGKKLGFAVSVDTQAFIKAMDLVNKEYFPKAITETVNTIGAAFLSRAKQSMEKELIIRSNYTRKSMFIYKSKYRTGRQISRINCKVGSRSPYMAIQEFGGTVKAQRRFVPIPTVAGRGGDLRKAIPRRLRMSSINVDSSEGGFMIGTPRGRRTRGLYQRKGGRLIMLRNLTKGSVQVPKSAWFSKPLDYFRSDDLWERTFRHHARKYLNRMK